MRIIMGKIVQIVSIIWLCKIILLFKLLINRDNIIYKIIILIEIIIIIAWLWKKVKFSIIGELASCKLIIDQMGISKKKFFYIWSLSSLHYSAIIEFFWDNWNFIKSMIVRGIIYYSFDWWIYK